MAQANEKEGFEVGFGARRRNSRASAGTSPSRAEDLTGSLAENLAEKRAEKRALSRTFDRPLDRHWDGAIDVAALRRRMQLTQREFAGLFGFSVGTLRHWERGNRRPTGTALVLLHVIANNPRAVRDAVRKARGAKLEPIPDFERLRSHRARRGLRSPV